MGSLIGVLSTVILVSTVCTLIFAVGAYVIARRGRGGVSTMEDGDMLPGEDMIEDQFPHRGEASTLSGDEGGLFKRVTPNSAGANSVSSNADDEYKWK